MNRIFSTLLVAMCVLAGGARAADEIAYIDVQEVFKRFYKTRLAQDQIRQQQQDITFERETMEGEIKTLKEDIETLRADSRDETLSDVARESKRNLLEEKLVELQKKEVEMTEFEKLRMQQIEQQNTRMSAKLIDEIQGVVVVYAKEKSLAGVIDRSAQGRNGLQVVLYTNPKLDITADVLAILNEGREDLLGDETPVNVE
jgi:outer membrane protein